MWATCLALVATAGVQLGAQPTTPLRKIYEMDLAIRALSATVEPTLVIPKAVAGGIRISLRSGSRELSLADAARVLGGDVHVEGELSGPGLPQTLTLPRPPSEGEPALPGDDDPLLLRLPALPKAGNYALANLRLVRGTTTVLDVMPRQVDIQVIDEILITSVKTRALTLDEIKSKGIVLDSDDYLGFEFTLAMKLESTPVNVSFPVVFDRQNIPLPELLQPPSVSREGVRLPTMVPVMLEAEALEGAGPGEKLALTPEEAAQARIPGILVIPGNIGYLKQFFSAQLFVANGAPSGSPLSVRNVTGTIELPKGDDGSLGTTDDPLSLAETTTGIHSTLDVRAVGPDGQSGTGDDVATLNPGDQGQAEFLLRGDQEGFHNIHFDISAVLDGLAVGPVKLKGRASGGVLVRNVFYDITFAAPAVVRDGERFKIFATVNNISQAIGNDIQVTIDAARLGNMRLYDPNKGTQSINTLMPGDAQTLEFEFVSEQTGQVVASYIKFNTTDGSTGRLSWFAAIGDRGVPLSPDTLVLPAVVDALPDNVLHAAMRVLGQAWSAATAPPGTLPSTVTRPSKELVLKKAQAVAEAGLRMTLGQTLAGALRDLTFDLYGGAGTTSQAASLATKIDRGFDQALRETSAGYALSQALGAALTPAASTAGGALAYERDVAQVAASGPDFISLAVDAASSDALDLSVTSAAGQRSVIGRTAADRPETAVPGLVFLPLGPVPAAQTLGLFSTTSGAPYTIDLAGRNGASTPITLSLTLPSLDGTFTRGQIVGVPLPAGARARLIVDPANPETLVLRVDIDGDGVAETEHPLMLETLHPQGANLLSANIIGPETLDNAAPFGQHAVLVFDRLVNADAAANTSAYTVPKNSILGARSVLSGRLVVLSLEQPEGSYVPTTLAVSGMPDLRGVIGTSGAPTNLGVRLQDIGAVVTGRVLNADGTPVPGGTLYYRNNKDLIECKLPPGGLPGISKVTLDADGRYEFRYVRQDRNCGFPFEITTVDPGTGGVVGTQRFVRAAGEHIVVDLLMFGRGSVTGTVRDTHGNGVGSADVVVLSGTDSQIGGKTKTNSQGQYTVHGITVGPVSVRAAKGGSLGYAAGRIDRASTTTTIDVSMDGGAVTVSGTVLRRHDGSTMPLPGAWVGYRVGGRSGPVVGVAQANEDGEYEITGMPTGAFALDATSEGFHGYADGIAAANDNLKNRDILIERPGVDNSGIVRGTVKYPSGAPGADAYVTVNDSGRGVLTGTNGTYEMPVPAGRPVTLRATLRNMSRSGSTTVELANPGDELNDVNITLSGLARAVVTVYEADGRTRVPNVMVRRLDCSDPCGCAAGTTNQDGQITIEGLRIGTTHLHVVRSVGAGFDQARASVTLSSDNQTGAVDLQFKGHGTVFGTVTDSDGQLLHGADIELTSMKFINDGAMCGLMPMVSHRVRTDTNGAFRITGVNVGPLSIVASHFSAPRRVGAQGALLGAGKEAEFNLKLIDTMAGELSGTVYLPDGVTVAGAGVEVTVNGMLPDITVRTNDLGKFAFAKILPQGNWTLTARDPITGGLVQTRISMRTGQDAIHNLRLKGRGTVRVTVVDGAGEEVTSAHVKLTEVDFPSRTYERSIEAAHVGVATFERIFEGAIALEASDVFGRGGRLSTVVPGPDAVVEATIRLSTTGTVTGRFFIPDPVHGTKPVSYGVVKILSNNRVIGQATTSADPDPEKTGTFTFDYVPAGPFRLEATDPASARTGVATGSVTTQDEEVVLNVTAQALGTVTGTALRNTDYQQNARVTVQSGQFKADTIADHLGRYIVTGVPEGRVIVTASLDGAFLRGTAEGTLTGENTTLTLDVSLHDSGTVEGQVTKSSGVIAPYVLVAASVTGSGGDRQSTTADGEGRFRFDHMPTGSVTVDVEQPGSIDRGRATVNVLADQTVNAAVQLNGVGALRVFARNKQNQPTEGYVEIKGTGTFPYTRGFTIGAGGDLTIPELLAGPVSVTLRTTSGTFKAYGTTTGAVTANQQPNQPDTITVQIQDSGTVRGRVVATDGVTGVNGAIVNVTVTGVQGLLSGATQPDGSFELHGVPLGTVTVRVSDPLGVGFKSGLTLTADPGEVNAGTIVLDDTAVSVVGIEPLIGTTGVPTTGTVVRLTFSDPLVDKTGISVWNGTQQINPAIDLVDGGRVATLTMTTWPSDSRIEVRASTAVTDIYGRRLSEPFTSWFRTADSAPPSVDSITPTDGTYQVNPIGVTVFVDFSEELDEAANIASVVTLTGPNGLIAGTNTLTGRRITFSAAYDLQANARYTVTVAGARDKNGNVQTGSTSARFSTTDTTPPNIQLSSPANGSKTTNRRPTIVFSVSDAVTEILASSGTMTVGALPPMQLTAVNGALRFTPTEDLPLGTVNVTASISDVTNHTATASGSFTVQLDPIGGLTGRLFLSDGTTPAAGRTVRAIPLGHSSGEARVTDANGAFVFETLDAQTFDVTAYNVDNKVRARERVTIVANSTISVDVQMAAEGRLVGTVFRSNGTTPAVDVPVEIQSNAPKFGGAYSVRTDANGMYSVERVTAGPVGVTVNDNVLLQRGEGAGTIVADQTATVNVTLVADAITLPQRLYDGNNYFIDLQTNGTGDSSPVKFALEIVKDGTMTPFTGASNGSREEGDREIAIRQANLAGLDVTRKVFVPSTGYFYRYLELLTNPGTSPVTVTVRVRTGFATGNGSPHIEASSSGDTQFAIGDPATTDRWVTLDDSVNADSGTLAMALVYDGAGASDAIDYADWLGTSPARAIVEWRDITIEPGQTAAVLHFGAHLASRAGAKYAAERLVQLPPEALVGLSAHEMGSIRNFVVPADRVGQVPALPALNGSINGRVFSNIGAATVSSATTRFRSAHPLFGRTWSTTTNSSGSYQFNQQISTNGNTRLFPIYDFVVTAEHPRTSVIATSVVGSFQTPPTATADVVFTGTGQIEGTVRWRTGAAAPNSTTYVAKPDGSGEASFATDGNGKFVQTGIPEGTQTIRAEWHHPNGPTIKGTATVAVTAGQITQSDITLGPVGTVTGTLRQADGTAISGRQAYVRVASQTGGGTWGLWSNTSNGTFTLANVPTDTYLLWANDPVTNVTAQVLVTVSENQSLTQDLTFIAHGTVTVEVRRANGAPATGIYVSITEAGRGGNRRNIGLVDGNGRITIPGVAQGAFTVDGYPNPDTRYTGLASGQIDTQGQIVGVTVTLPPYGTISGRVTRASGTHVPSVFVRAYRADNVTYEADNADSNGYYTIDHVWANEPIRVFAQTGSELRHAMTSLVDGETKEVNLVLTALATVRVTVRRADGTPIPSTLVKGRDEYSGVSWSQQTTNTSGVATFTNVREGQALFVATSIHARVTHTILASDHGQTIDLTITEPPAGTLRGTVFAADGVTPVRNSVVRLIDPDTTDQWYSAATDSETGVYQIANVRGDKLLVRASAPAPLDSNITVEKLTAIQTAGATETVDLNLPLSAVVGRVYFGDGVTPVSRPTLLVSQPGASPGAPPRTFVQHWNNTNGEFVVLGPFLGDFTIAAQDSASGLMGETTGTVVQRESTVPLDITLQQSGTVTGVLRHASGSTASGYIVRVASSGLNMTRGLYTGSGGTYTFTRVAAGTILLHANTGAAVGGAHTAITVQDETVTANISYLPTGTVRGKVFAADGVTPVAGATVHVYPHGPHGQDGWPSTNTTTDAAGQFTANSVPHGVVRAVATSGGPNYQAGLVDGVLTAAGPLDAPPIVLNDNARWLYNGRTHVLTDAGGFRWDLDCRGKMVDGSSNAYNYSVTLTVSGVLFPCATGATASPDGRTTGFGPFSFSNAVRVTRDVFVPTDGSFARYVESFTNETAAPISILVEVASDLGANWNNTVIVAPSTTGGTFAVTDNGGADGGNTTPAVGHVFAGAGATAMPIAKFYDGNWAPTLRWQLTIAPGQTVGLMHFQAQRVLRADAQAQAAALANLTDPVALIGLTPAQRASIVNFVVP